MLHPCIRLCSVIHTHIDLVRERVIPANATRLMETILGWGVVEQVPHDKATGIDASGVYYHEMVG